MCTETVFEKARAEAAKRFEVAGRRYSLADMLEANACDTDLCEWLANAEIGDRHPDGETCTRVADMVAPASAADVAPASGFAGPAVEFGLPATPTPVCGDDEQLARADAAYTHAKTDPVALQRGYDQMTSAEMQMRHCLRELI